MLTSMPNGATGYEDQCMDVPLISEEMWIKKEGGKEGKKE